MLQKSTFWFVKTNFHIVILCILFLFSYCTKKQTSVIGNYKNIKPNSLLAILENKNYVGGCTLNINSDSSYVYNTCGNHIEGNWQIKDDSIYLYCKKNEWSDDSLKITGFEGRFPSCGTIPEAFKIEKGYLINTLILNKKKFYNKLVKE
jgi:hypothetical protein